MATVWISQRADAGLRAALGLCQEPGLVSARTLAGRTGLSAAFVAQVLGRLRRGGVVESVAGRHGGYRLSRPADRISVGEVLRATGATMAPIACADADARGDCAQREQCRLLPVWARVAAASAAVVDTVTLRDLARP